MKNQQNCFRWLYCILSILCFIPALSFAGSVSHSVATQKIAVVTLLPDKLKLIDSVVLEFGLMNPILSVVDVKSWKINHYLQTTVVNLVDNISLMSDQFNAMSSPFLVSEKNTVRIIEAYDNEEIDYDDEARLLANIVGNTYDKVIVITGQYGIAYRFDGREQTYQMFAGVETFYYDLRKNRRISIDTCCGYGQRLSLLPVESKPHHTFELFGNISKRDLAYLASALKQVLSSNITGSILRVLKVSSQDIKDNTVEDDEESD